MGSLLSPRRQFEGWYPSPPFLVLPPNPQQGAGPSLGAVGEDQGGEGLWLGAWSGIRITWLLLPGRRLSSPEH